jgi:hypothetical protein
MSTINAKPQAGAPTRRDRMVDLSDVPGGVSSNELQAVFEMTAKDVNTNMSALTVAGRVFKAKRAGDRVRWFKRRDMRDAWLLEMQRGETMHTVVPKAQRTSLKPKPKGPRLVDVHQHLPSRARKPGAKCPPLQGSEMERPLPTEGVRIDPKWTAHKGEVLNPNNVQPTRCASPGFGPNGELINLKNPPPVFSGPGIGHYTDPASTWAKAAARGAST